MKRKRTEKRSGKAYKESVHKMTDIYSTVVKQPGSEDDHSRPSSTEGKNVWSSTSTPPIHLDVLLN